MCEPGKSCNQAKADSLAEGVTDLTTALAKAGIGKAEATDKLAAMLTSQWKDIVELYHGFSENLSKKQRHQFSDESNTVGIMLLVLNHVAKNDVEHPADGYWASVCASAIESIKRIAAEEDVRAEKRRDAILKVMPEGIPAEIRDAVLNLAGAAPAPASPAEVAAAN